MWYYWVIKAFINSGSSNWLIRNQRFTFPKGIKTKPDETVVFSYIVYKSRQQRDAVNKKIMNDPRIQAMCDPNNMPFDAKRMLYGGFKAVVEI